MKNFLVLLPTIVITRNLLRDLLTKRFLKCDII